MEELIEKFNTWKEVIEFKELKVNIAKTKVMVSGNGIGNGIVPLNKYVGRGRRRPEGSSFICSYPKVGQGTTPFPGQLRLLTQACWYTFINLGRMKV